MTTIRPIKTVSVRGPVTLAILLYLASFTLPGCANPVLGNSASVSRTATSVAPGRDAGQKLADLLKDESNKNIAQLAALLQSREFRTFFARTNSIQEPQVWRNLEQLYSRCQASTDTENSAVCMAVIAHLDNMTGRSSKAELRFKESIAKFKAIPATEGASEQNRRLSYSNASSGAVERCKIALALLYCHQKKYSEAEKIYDEIVQPFKARNLWFSNPETEFQNYAFRDGNSGAAMLGLIAALAQGFADTGEIDKAAIKFDLVRVLSASQSLYSPENISFGVKSYDTQVIMSMSSTEDSSYSFLDGDSIIGKYPSLVEALEWYLKFDCKHPQMRSKENVAAIKSLLAARKIERDKADSQARNYKWLSLQGELLTKLEAEPDKTMAAFTKVLEQMRRADSKAPEFSYSLNGLGYRLMQLGRYADAEPLLVEALKLRKQIGPQSAIGQSASNLALLYLETGKLSEANSLIDSAIVLRAGDQSDQFAVAKSKLVKGRILAAQGRLAEAEEILNDCISKLSSDSSAKRTSANKAKSKPPLLPLKDPSKMLEDLQAYTASSLLELESQSVAGFYRCLATLALSSVYTSEKKLDRARQSVQNVLADRALKTSMYADASIEPSAWLQLALVEIAAGDLAKSKQYLKQAKTLNLRQKLAAPALAQIFEVDGLLNSKLGDKAKACASYRKALVLVQAMLGSTNKRTIQLVKKVANSSSKN